MSHLTPEQRQAAEQQGLQFVPAAEHQIAPLSMQRRIFWIAGQPFLAVRPDGSRETAATLQALLARAPLAITPDLAPLLAATPQSEPLQPALSAAALPAVQPVPAAAPVAATEIPRAAPVAAAPLTRDTALADTAQLVATYVAACPVAPEDLPALIQGVHRAVTALHISRQKADATAPRPITASTPAPADPAAAAAAAAPPP